MPQIVILSGIVNWQKWSQENKEKRHYPLNIFSI